MQPKVNKGAWLKYKKQSKEVLIKSVRGEPVEPRTNDSPVITVFAIHPLRLAQDRL